jgi:16S rRNA (uracil1498-N3)-methyltransferase
VIRPEIPGSHFGLTIASYDQPHPTSMQRNVHSTRSRRESPPPLPRPAPARRGDGLRLRRSLARSGNARSAPATSRSSRLPIRRQLEDTGRVVRSNSTLAQALARGDRFDLVVQKATELGVTRIIPVDQQSTAETTDNRGPE